MDDDLENLAKQAQALNEQMGITSEDMYEALAEGIRKIPDQLQMMVDSFVSMQKSFPMPREGWEAFVRDLEYTNQKHGFNLVIKSELLEGQTHLEVYEAYAKALNKSLKELTENERRQAIVNSIIDSEI